VSALITLSLIHAQSLTPFGQKVFNYSVMKDQTQLAFQVAALTNMLLVKRPTVVSPLGTFYSEPVSLGIF